MSTVNRYYAQWINEDTNIGWFIFDRELTTQQGDTEYICQAINRRQAYLILDALNARPR